MAKRRGITQGKLKKILEVHQTWVESEGKEGGRANLRNANLQGADLFGANLQGAVLSDANLQEAFLQEANLQKAVLSKADLQDAGLLRANLREANLLEANLQKARLFLVTLQNTHLIFANLQQARGLSESQVRQAKNWRQAFYNDDFLKELGLPPDHNKKLKKVLAELEKKKKEAATKK